MKIAIVLFVAALLYGVFLVATQSRLTGEQAHALVGEEHAALIDVRTPEEFAAGHIEGARNIPHGEIRKRAAEIGPPEAPVVLYCQSGVRSLMAVKALKRAGFQRVYNLGPMSAWSAAAR